MDDRFEVVVGAGSLRSDGVQFPHRWTPGGVSVEAVFTGGHLLHLAAAGCVLNDLSREADALGIELYGVRVSAAGGVDPQTWQSSGVAYPVELRSSATSDQLNNLLDIVDDVAEVPRAIRAGAPVRRVTR
ncbi:MAG: osmotically inducible protein OsmC [Pseudonocardiales bacterium]|nr:osmotically inducible protein OsmC [Pseudonocardiales bacterium]